MNITIRPMTKAEHKYSYTESPQLMAQTGCIGHLRGDMGSNGLGFYTSWDDHQPDLKTTDFKAELDTVINALRFDAAYGGVLAGRDKLAAYCCAHPDSRMDQDGRNFGFRADTDGYTYMLRLNPHRGEYNLYVYCYVREHLDDHMTRAKRGIRFVSSHYWDLFRLTDGDHIRITASDGGWEERTCRFIDDTHMECDGTLYHIHDFAEQMEQAGNTIVPLRSSLPEKCFAALETTGETIVVHRGVMGYTPTGQRPEGLGSQKGADVLNAQIGVTKAQAAAMLAGSMFGWACPGADPANYDEQGRPIKRKGAT